MINDTRNLQRKMQALLKLREENWTAVDEGVSGPQSSVCENPLALSCCVVLQCLSGTDSLEHNDLISFDE